MKIIVYVEGQSDKRCLETLLDSFLCTSLSTGIQINIISLGNKKNLLTPHFCTKVINILRNVQDNHVIVVPDLYPQNILFEHQTFEELREGILHTFSGECRRLNLETPNNLLSRFHIHCFKHDLEVLLLASIERLIHYLGLKEIPNHTQWDQNVEDQNFNRPPKRIVEELFLHCGKHYNDILDAPRILENSNISLLANRCPQQFSPFLQTIQNITGIRV